MRIRTCRRCNDCFSTPSKYAKYCDNCKKPTGYKARKIVLRGDKK